MHDCVNPVSEGASRWNPPFQLQFVTAFRLRAFGLVSFTNTQKCDKSRLMGLPPIHPVLPTVHKLSHFLLPSLLIRTELSSLPENVRNSLAWKFSMDAFGCTI